MRRQVHWRLGASTLTIRLMRRLRSLCALTLFSALLSPMVLAQPAPAPAPPAARPTAPAPAQPAAAAPTAPAAADSELQLRPPELEVSDPMLEDPPGAPNELSDWRQA